MEQSLEDGTYKRGQNPNVDHEALEAITLKSSNSKLKAFPPKPTPKKSQEEKKEEKKEKNSSFPFTFTEIALFLFGLYGAVALGRDLKGLISGLFAQFQKTPDILTPSI